ncbi:MAG TPA: efflux RND transporter periplasmic adaptor subunit [Woeseiaceae bacterium]|nr:efflux RND transporter periplasmic adaptor subunit [Woeseiaceae bacterium]
MFDRSSIKGRKIRRRHRSPAFHLLLAGLFATASAQPQTARDLPFDTIPAIVKVAPLERLFDGRVEAVNRATMSAQTGGRIAEIFYDVDDYVEAGSPIIRFTDVEQRAMQQQAEAALKEALARSNEAQEEFVRSKSLFDAGSGSKREYERALATRDAARARVTAARSALKSAQQQVEYTLVRAPYAGIVTERHVEAGESVGVGQPLMSGLSLEALRVSVDLPQQVAIAVRNRKLAEVLTDDQRITPAELTMFPYADPETNTFRVRLELPAGQFSLYPGMFVKVAFVVGEAERLLVPTTALLRRSEVTGLYVVGADDAVRLRQVRIGNEFGSQTEVLAGLEVDELVAADPLRAGIYVKSLKDGRHD